MSIMVSRWSWAAVLLFGVNSVTEYVLLFLFLTFDWSTFTKLINEVQLDLHVHTPQNSDMIKAKVSEAWRRIKQAGHDLLFFLVSHICIMWSGCSKLVFNQDLLVHVSYWVPTSIDAAACPCLRWNHTSTPHNRLHNKSSDIYEIINS